MLTTPIFVYQNHDIVERRDKKLIRHNFSRRQLGALIRRKRDGDSAISDKNWLAVEFNFRTIAWWTDAKGPAQILSSVSTSCDGRAWSGGRVPTEINSSR